MPATILSDNGASSGTAGLKTSGSNDGILELQTTTGGGTATAAITIDTAQRSKFPTTIGVGGATPATSGSGISFPATASASSDANTLDDYEEGTWTPSIGGNATYTASVGRYLKIGKFVYFTADVQINVLGTGSGTTISGLPFTSATATEAERGTACPNLFSSLAATIVFTQARVNTNNTTLTWASMTSGTTSLSDVSILGTGTRIVFAGSYIALD
jgi:hypothetical protein